MDALQNPAWLVNFCSLSKNDPLLLFTLLLIMSNHARLLSIRAMSYSWFCLSLLAYIVPSSYNILSPLSSSGDFCLIP